LDLPDPADADALHAIHADPESWAHFPSGVHTHRDQAVEMVRTSARQFEEHGLGYWSVRESESGPVVGRAGCAVPTGRPWWNLYYRLAGTVHGRGYATEVAARALEAAHDVAPHRPVLAYLLEHNVASRRTAERLGMRLVWRGPDRPNPDPGAVRLVYVDREPDPATLDAVEAFCSGAG
jgi:RimJ/RimL family protein N-acetyltransferase